ncbi:hypothetical protein [Legionella gresilensis]|uniref:hypothetical protein n=1 Tax=Legionella gresilensis TaxID=91823 RepID=UPI0010418514|nr:hypothetical protein [Legionella gresilensis]
MATFTKLKFLSISIALAASPLVLASPNVNLPASQLILADNGGWGGHGGSGGKGDWGGKGDGKWGGKGSGYGGDGYGGGHHKHHKHHKHHWNPGHYWYSGWKNVFWYPDIYFWKHGHPCVKSCYKNKWGKKLCNVQCDY